MYKNIERLKWTANHPFMKNSHNPAHDKWGLENRWMLIIIKSISAYVFTIFSSNIVWGHCTRNVGLGRVTARNRREETITLDKQLLILNCQDETGEHVTMIWPKYYITLFKPMFIIEKDKQTQFCTQHICSSICVGTQTHCFQKRTR